MFGRKQGPPATPFIHSPGCLIARADADFQPEWDEVKRGHFRRECRCGAEDHFDSGAGRERQDPRDPKLSHHAGECQYRDADAAMLQVLLEVRRGLGSDDYSWVTCLGCDTSWAVLDYAASVG